MLKKHWKLQDKPSSLEIQNLRQAINASELLATILIQRSLKDFNAVKSFFAPQSGEVHDPFLMKDMDRAVERITSAIEKAQSILVYGDYDVDGTTAVALVHGFLSEYTERVHYYIPDRYKEGYGISKQGIEFAADNDIDLIIALDCGIKAIEQVEYSSSLGIDFIICDHHLPSDIVPKAVAVLNPLQKTCHYPFKHLSGCGIGFKLVQALLISWDESIREADQYLDLVAIAAACDIVAMIGENRVLTAKGIALLNQSMRPGLELLLGNAKPQASTNYRTTRNLSVTDLVFVFGPRINAAGRIAHGKSAVELLTAKTTRSAEKVAEEVNESNTKRKSLDKSILDEALSIINDDDDFVQAKSTVLFKNSWSKGVVGIAASRLQEHFYRPTIVLTESNGKITGSARSVEGFDIHKAISSCEDLLVNFGGHPAAAGLTLEKENLPAFKERFEREVSLSIQPQSLVPSIDISAEADFTELTTKFLEQLNRLSPFGPKNMKPVFASRNVMATSNTKLVGEDQTHLKLEVFQAHNPNLKLSGIAFKQYHKFPLIKTGQMFDIAYKLEWNYFRGERKLQLMVEDIQVHKED